MKNYTLYLSILLSVAVAASSCSNRSEELNDYPKSQSFIDSAINKAISVVSQLSLKEKLAQLQWETSISTPSANIIPTVWA